ncbi:hypothetical protein Tco_1359484 [Tanacetum coccineum]
MVPIIVRWPNYSMATIEGYEEAIVDHFYDEGSRNVSDGILLDLELKDLPSHLEYAFLEGDDKLPVIIAKNLKDEDKTALIKVLKSHKHAIAWKISDIKGIDP